VLQAPVFDGSPFDFLSFEQDGLTAPEVNVCRREVFQALVVTPMIVVTDEGANLRLEVARQIIVLQKDAVLERLMPALDLALRLWMIGRPFCRPSLPRASALPLGSSPRRVIALRGAVFLRFRSRIVGFLSGDTDVAVSRAGGWWVCFLACIIALHSVDDSVRRCHRQSPASGDQAGGAGPQEHSGGRRQGQ
jgi:hypothetical protein